MIERGTPGFEVSKKLDKMGWRASDTAILSFDHCRVPVSNLVGEENAGFLAIMMNFVAERVGLATQCVAISELAYRESVQYAKQRLAFGKSLTGFQVIRHKLRVARRAPVPRRSPVPDRRRHARDHERDHREDRRLLAPRYGQSITSTSYSIGVEVPLTAT